MSLAQLFYFKETFRQRVRKWRQACFSPRKRRRERRFVLEQLEQRILLDAVPTGTVTPEELALFASVAVVDQAQSSEIITDAAVVEGASVTPSSFLLELPKLQLVDDNPANFAGQMFYLDYDGATGVHSDGPVRVDGIEVPAFQAPTPFSGEESTILGSVLADLNQGFAELGVTFTGIRPDAGTNYSTVFLGGDDASFSSDGSFLGLAEQVDVGNKDHTDNALVFSDKVYSRGMTFVD